MYICSTCGVGVGCTFALLVVWGWGVHLSYLWCGGGVYICSTCGVGVGVYICSTCGVGVGVYICSTCGVGVGCTFALLVVWGWGCTFALLVVRACFPTALSLFHFNHPEIPTLAFIPSSAPSCVKVCLYRLYRGTNMRNDNYCRHNITHAVCLSTEFCPLSKCSFQHFVISRVAC